jgi:predicted nucleotidyltransferase
MKLNLDILTSTVAAIPEIAACYLFGSAAKNEPVVNDIDLLILVYPEADAEKVLWTATEKISDALNLPADMMDILLFDLTMANPRVLYAAVTNGILIKNASPDILGDRIESISLYFLENENAIQRAAQLNREMIGELCDNG